MVAFPIHADNVDVPAVGIVEPMEILDGEAQRRSRVFPDRMDVTTLWAVQQRCAISPRPVQVAAPHRLST